MAGDRIPENLKQRLKASYDAIAPKYNSWTTPNSQQRLHYLNKLLSLLQRTDASHNVSMLELGCGCGLPVTQQLLSSVNFHVTANDLSSAQIAAAKENLTSDDVGGRLQLVEGDMAGLSFPEESFDAAIGMYSLIHLPRVEQEELIGKIMGWLKPGGYFLANFSEEATDGVVFEKWLDEKGWVYWSGFGAETTVEKIKEAGFEVVLNEVAKDAVDASFLWVIAKKADRLE
ncbi:methyltransferase [Xylariales sp. AK1849]|nr:methyltransferase [Xylariales sp. AK1849]